MGGNWPPNQGGHPPAAPNPPSIGHIAVTSRTPPLTQWGYRSMNTPQIFLDGYLVARGWGRMVFPSWPGRHHLQVQVRGGLGMNVGRADIYIDVYSGRLVELDYVVPRFGGSTSLTYVPRR